MAEFVEDIKDAKSAQAFVAKVDTASLNEEVDEFVAKFLDMSDNAKNHESAEKKMSIMEGIRTFPKAAAWSIVLSTALVMEGYDKNLLSSLFAMPAFQRRYGVLVKGQDPNDPNAKYELESRIQTVLNMVVNVGEIIGLLIAGVMADRFGYRITLIFSLMLVTAFIFIVFFAHNIGMLIAGELLLGFPWGAFQTLTVSYASEVCPMVLRVYLTTYVNVCWVFGQLISSGVLRGLVNNETDLAYRLPFALQWIWPIPIAIGVFLAPESPWWLLKTGKSKEARRSLSRLISENKQIKHKGPLVDAIHNQISLTLAQESVKTGSNYSYLDCFKGTNLRRTRITCMIWLIQNITGSALMGYSTYFYVQAGLSTNMSFTFSIIQYCLGILGTFGSWFVSQRLGRFTIYFGGLVVNTCVMMTVGGLGTASSVGASWGIGSLLLVFTFVYDLTIGPLCYCIVAEMPSSKVRTKTIILARGLYNIAGIVISVVSPYMLNPTAWNWGAKTGFFWGGLALCCAIWCWFELPETKNKTYAELDVLFESGIRARAFKTANVESIDTEEIFHKIGKEGVRDLVEKDVDDKESA